MSYGKQRIPNERGLVMPEGLGDEQDDVANWPALDKMIAGTHPTVQLHSNVNPGGGGGSISTAPGSYIQTIVVTPAQSLQAAIDAAPVSNTLIRSTTAVTSVGAGVYSVVSSTRPTRVFVDADEGAERPAEFNSSGALTNENAPAAFVWAWDQASSRVFVYKYGNAITEVTLADYVAVIATDRASYDAIDLRPGIFVHGLGRSISEIRPTTIKLDTSLGSMEYAVRIAAYSGIVGMRVSRPARIGTGTDCCGILFAKNRVADQFVFQDSELVVESDFYKYTDGPAYKVGIFLGSQEISGGRAKNVQFINSPLRCFAQVDLIETYSAHFNGLIRIVDSPVHGNVYFDGKTQTVKFINSPLDNQNTITGLPRPIQPFSPLAFNVTGPGGQAPFPGESYYLEFINSPVRAVRPFDPDTAADIFKAFSWDGRVAMRFENSPVSGEVGFLKSDDAGYNAAEAARLYSINSDMPPLKVTGYSTAQRTPLVPASYVETAATSVGATELTFGAFSMTYDELVRRKKAVVQIQGAFAANANSKTVNFKQGLSGAVATVKTVTGTYSGTEFAAYASISFSGGFVTVALTTVSDDISTLKGVFRTALASGEVFACNFSCVGVANADITVRGQQMNVAG